MIRGINAHVPGDETLDLIEELGIEWVRVDIIYGKEKQNERLLRRLEGRRLRVLASLSAEMTTTPDGWADWCADWWCPIQFDAYGIWNEPNLRRFWTGGVERYIEEILIPGAEAIQSSRVAAPDLSHRGSWDAWLDAILARAGHLIDIVTHHMYPNTVDWCAWNISEERSLPWQIPSVRQVMRRHGHDKLWITEIGKRSDAGEKVQAKYLTECWKLPAEGVFLYEIKDDPRLPHGFGIVDENGRKKKAWYALGGS